MGFMLKRNLIYLSRCYRRSSLSIGELIKLSYWRMRLILKVSRINLLMSMMRKGELGVARIDPRIKV
jgi:hypothetical protein